MPTSQHLSGYWESSPKDHQEVKVLLTSKNKESICAHSGAQQWNWISGPSLEHSGGRPWEASEVLGQNFQSYPSFIIHKIIRVKGLLKTQATTQDPLLSKPSITSNREASDAKA